MQPADCVDDENLTFLALLLLLAENDDDDDNQKCGDGMVACDVYMRMWSWLVIYDVDHAVAVSLSEKKNCMTFPLTCSPL